MLGLPRMTEVSRRVAKEKIYAHVGIGAQLKDCIKDQIEAVIWRNKLAPGTFNVSVGETVSEIQVFEVQLRQRGLDKRILPVIAKAIPYRILFLLTFEGKAQAWMEAEGKFYHTEWMPIEGLTLKFDGLNLDAVYASLVRQIAGGRLATDGDISEAVQRDSRRTKLEKDIAALEKKLLREKQFNRQVELNSELRKLRVELEGLA